MAIHDRYWPSDPIALDELREVWDLECGDRRIELAFVAEGMDSVDLSRRLDACLLTRAELFLDEDLWGLFHSLTRREAMGRYGQVAGKRPMSGHNVSYANNRPKRQFLPNFYRKRYFLKGKDCSVSLSVSVHGMKGMDTKGLLRVVAVCGLPERKPKAPQEKGVCARAAN